MKKVVKGFSPTEEVLISTVDPEKYYGIDNGNGNDKGFITQEGYRSGEYKALSSDGVTHANGWSWFSKSDLGEMIDNLIDRGFSVYQFDRSKELFKWLSE